MSFILALSPFFLYAQLTESEFILPSDRDLSLDSLSNQVYASIPDEFRDRDPLLLKQFSDQEAYQLYHLLRSANTYADWSELEDYLNGLVLKILPEKYHGNMFNKAYVVKNGEFNAFMMPSGRFFVNIGLIAGAENESGLAVIIAHELAHFYLSHSIKNYLRKVEDFKWTTKAEWGIEYRNKNSRKNELEADSLALIWLNNAGYDVRKASYTFEAMELISKNKLRKHPFEKEVVRSTHPLSKERLAAIQRFLDKQALNEQLQPESEQFQELVAMAKVETLKAMLENLDYLDCAELAFKYHILDPDNPEYIYYILEGVRRNCLLHNNDWDSNFITGKYYQKVDKNYEGPKPRMKESIFEVFDGEILCMTSRQLRDVKATFYWKGERKFNTNYEAFLFFFEVGKAMENNEVFSSAALAFQGEKSKENATQYIEKSSSEKTKFIEAMINDSLSAKLAPKRLLVMNGIVSELKLGKSDFPVRVRDSSDFYMNQFMEELRSHFELDSMVYLPDLLESDPQQYTLYNKAQSLSLMMGMLDLSTSNFIYIDPSVWQLMMDCNANELVFINTRYMEFRNQSKSVDDFELYTNLELKTVLEQNIPNRYLTVFAFGLKIDSSGQKVSFYTLGEEAVKKKYTGKEILIEKIVENVNKVSTLY